MGTSAPYPDTLRDLLVQGYRRGGDRTAVIHGNKSLSYSDIASRSAAIAAGMHRVGMEPGHRIGVLIGNRLEDPVIDASIAQAGGVRVPLNPMYSHREVEHVLSDADVDAIIVDRERKELLDAVESELLPLEHRYILGRTSANGYERFDTLRVDNHQTLDVDRSPEDPAAIYYTGGTTGKPKGVLYSERVLVRNLLAHLVEFDIGSSDVGWLAPPLSHSAGTFLATALLAGGRVVIQDGFEVRQLVDAIRDEDVTWTMLVPTMLYRLLEADDSALDPVSRLDRIYYGTAPVIPDKLRQAVERFGPIFVQFYGQTEVPNLITTFSAAAHERAVEEANSERLQSAGTPVLQAQVRIEDLDSDAEIESGDAGEVVVAAPYVFDQYLDRPEATAATLREGWVYTGDIGRLDDEGYLFLLDRKGNLITTGGMNVYPREVEAVLSEHPAIVDSAVIGIPDEDWGESVHAVVVSNSAEKVAESALIEFAGERLAGYKVPKSVAIRDRLPRTNLGKIDRESLRNDYWKDTNRSIH